MYTAAATALALGGPILVGAALRWGAVLPRGAGGTLLRLCVQLTLPALLLHTVPHALDLALDTPLFGLLPGLGIAHLVAVAVRSHTTQDNSQRADTLARLALTRFCCLSMLCPPRQAFCALVLRGQRAADRTLGVGCVLCPDVAAATFPVLEAAFGAPGLLAGALLAVPAGVGTALGAPCVFALGRLAGAGAPEGELAPGQRSHLDGGVYDGDWFEGAKQGSGVYVYTRYDPHGDSQGQSPWPADIPFPD